MEQTQKAAPSNPRLDYEMTVCEIERERDFWLLARSDANRAGGWDSKLNQTWEQRRERMDYLLEELFGQMGRLAVQGEGDGNRPE